MSGKLFVGGLAWGTGDAALYDVFGKIGELAEAKVSKNRSSGVRNGISCANTRLYV
jgi:hypothetical protein